MGNIISIAIRTVFTFVAFLAIQYVIPYFFLVPGGLLAGAFLWKTGDDKNLGYGLMIGSAIYGIFYHFYGKF